MSSDTAAPQGGGIGRGYITNPIPPAPGSNPSQNGLFDQLGGFAGANKQKFPVREVNPCRKCGKNGHRTTECTEEDNGSAAIERGTGCNVDAWGQPVTVKVMKNDRDTSEDLPTQQEQSQKKVVQAKRDCFKCGSKEHRGRDCPSDRAGGGVGSSQPLFVEREARPSTYLNLVNTDEIDGAMGAGGGTRRGLTCYGCSQDGHIQRNCPNGRGGGRGQRDMTCRLCGKEGHFSRNCTESELRCHNCKETGHKLADCLVNGRKPSARYIPVEEGEETLFDGAIEPGEEFDKLFTPEVQASSDGPAAPSKITNFTDGGFGEQLMENIKRADYKKPTPIQCYAIPVIQSGRDIMGCAQTGSGKTAAYLLPIINAMLNKQVGVGDNAELLAPVCIIIAPTRELAVQIYKEARKFAYATTVKAEVVYGGVDVQHQVERIKQGCGIVVGTVGRLIHLIRQGQLGLHRVQWLVLDEADRMLDLGFEPEIRSIVRENDMPDKTQRQTLMFSATFPESIQQLAKDFLNDFCFCTVGKLGGANTSIQQQIKMVGSCDKKMELEKLISEELRAEPADNIDLVPDEPPAQIPNTKKILIFAERKRNVDFLGTYMSSGGHMATTIHGDRLQCQREEALRDFKTGRMPILIATAVAARGLDIKGVDLVINFDMPQTIEDYVHRIGRTGRVGNRGRAISFYDPDCDRPMADEILEKMRDARQEVPDWLLTEARAGGATSSFEGLVVTSTEDGKDKKQVLGKDDEW